jgi:tRNA(adenine34) deaminase
MCAGAIVLGRVGRIVYGAADPKAGAVESVFQLCSSKKLNHRPVICRGVMGEECGEMLTEFFRERRRLNKARREAGMPRRTARRTFAEQRRRAS